MNFQTPCPPCAPNTSTRFDSVLSGGYWKKGFPPKGKGTASLCNWVEKMHRRKSHRKAASFYRRYRTRIVIIVAVTEKVTSGFFPTKFWNLSNDMFCKLGEEASSVAFGLTFSCIILLIKLEKMPLLVESSFGSVRYLMGKAEQ